MDNHPEEFSRNTRRAGIKWIVLFVAVVVFGLAVWQLYPRLIYKTAAQNPYECGGLCSIDPEAAVYEIGGITLKYNARGVKVINNSSDDWKDCDPIGINGYFLNNSPSINSHSSLSIPYKNFTTRGNYRLNTKAVRPTEFSIICYVNEKVHASKFTLE